MNCNKLLNATRKYCWNIVRFQHGGDITSLDKALPPNLVLFGISKDQFEPKTFLEKVSPGHNIPLVRKCVEEIPKHKSPISVWVDNLLDAEPKFNVAAQLHPLVFGVHPRMDILFEVVRWQQRYKDVDYTWSRTRAELGKGKKKPWPQKKTGRVRAGSRNAPGWKNGGISQGPRGPISLFYKPPDAILTKGLTIALTVKLIQNDLIIVDDLELPDTDCFENSLDNRDLSNKTLLFIHSQQKFPENLGKIAEHSKAINLMPTRALNVWSILKHDKLLLTLDMLDDLESKLIWQMTRYHWLGEPHNFYKDMPGTKGLKAEQEMLYQNANETTEGS